MKTKLVNRYYCDFCRKSYQVRAVMAQHEKTCVKNPNRVCGLCEEAGVDQPAIADLIAAASLDESVLIEQHPDGNDGGEPLEIEPDNVRRVAGGCPACMLAGIAQAKLDTHFRFDFVREKLRFYEEQFGPEDTHG